MKKTLLVLFLFVTNLIFSQDIIYAKHIVDTLTSPTFWGRGYTKNGMGKAAAYLVQQMKQIGLQPMVEDNFLQNFTYPVNTFPEEVKVKADGKMLMPGRDFIIGPDSRAIKGKATLEKQDDKHFVDRKKQLTVSIEEKLTWSVARKVGNSTSIIINRNSIAKDPLKLQVNISNKFISSFQASNVCGLVKGTLRPDSFILFTAHYDHLGGMGKSTFFPGANDNASGVSLLLSLAKYYAANPQPYSIGFICFAGEEAGLLGSKHFTENPVLVLDKVRFLTNVDLVGTGDEGITIVNATIFPAEFTRINQINDENKLFVKINPRGKAANSDHYWFTEKGVPSFFIYTLGGIKAYHDVFDKAETLPLTEYDDLFKLIISFNKQLIRHLL